MSHPGAARADLVNPGRRNADGDRIRYSRHFIGEVGLGSFRRDLSISQRGIPEAGWVISSAESGKGFATEAMTAALAWADSARAFPLTFALLDPKHAASIRVAQKLGFGSPSEEEFRGEPALVLQRRRGGASCLQGQSAQSGSLAPE